MAAFTITDQDRRTARALALVIVVLILTWSVGTLRMAVLLQVVVQGVLVAGAYVALFVLNGWLLAMKPSDRLFVAAFRRLLGDFNAVIWRASPPDDGFLQELSAVIDRFAAVEAPSDDWHVFQTDLVAHYERRLQSLREGDLPETEVLMTRDWPALEERYLDLYSSKSSFWQGCHKEVPRSD